MPDREKTTVATCVQQVAPAAKVPRKQYQAPRLQRYGRIDVLTQTTSTGTRVDGTGRKRTSDLRAKENLVRIGQHPLGFGLYLYNYRPAFSHCGTGRQFGVIAQEVEALMPQAVHVDAQGLRSVDYGLLGIETVPCEGMLH